MSRAGLVAGGAHAGSDWAPTNSAFSLPNVSGSITAANQQPPVAIDSIVIGM